MTASRARESAIDLSATAPGSSGTRATMYGFTIGILSLVVMLAGASAPSPFYPALAIELGFDASVITVVFAVYALTLLATLLTAGSMSDYLGRRPVAITGLLLLAFSMFIFWHADSVTLLIAARLVQGLASGLLLSAVSAAITDLEPQNRPGSAAMWTTVGPMIGLAVGALVAGIALDLSDAALAWVFAPFTAAYLLLAVLFWFVPETAPRGPGVFASLSLKLTVPRAMRREFFRNTPAMFAGWATGGLFLALGANIVHAELGGVAHVWQGLSVAILSASGAAAAFLIRRRSARTIAMFGTATLALGTLLSLIALPLESLPGYFLAVVVTGAGFGTAFYGALASIAPLIPAHQRADVFAVIFLVSYTAFGLPSVIAGSLVPVLGLTTVTFGYGIFVILVAVTAFLLRVKRASSE